MRNPSPGKIQSHTSTEIRTLFGTDVKSSRALSRDVTLIVLDNGQCVVIKGVSRQSSDTWQPGNPWTEPVVTDLLHFEGAPVPKLLAVDIQNGWMATEYVEGKTLRTLKEDERFPAFTALVTGLRHVEDVIALNQTCIKELVGPEDSRLLGTETLVGQVRSLLQPDAAHAWDKVIANAGIHVNSPLSTKGEAYDQVDDPRPGPLDVHARNVVWTNNIDPKPCDRSDRPPLENPLSTVFFDLATVGYAWTEQRLAAYAQSIIPTVSTLLTPKAYDWYGSVTNKKSLYRLIAFDFIYWMIALTRVDAAMNASQTPAGKAARNSWGQPERLGGQIVRMWRRRRIDDDRVNSIRHGLSRRFVRRLDDGRNRHGE